MAYPAEVPASILDRPKPGGIGGPAEIPPPEAYRTVSVAQLVNEVFRLRNRVHVLESSILVTKLQTFRGYIGGGIGGPNEIPVPEGEGGSGWGGWNGPIPGEIHEIAELPISTLVSEVSSLLTRFAHFEKTMTQQLGQLTQRLDSIKK